MEKEYLKIFENKTERTPEEAYKSLSMRDLKEPYSQAEMYRQHCDMLITFAQGKKSKDEPKEVAQPEAQANLEGKQVPSNAE